MVDDMEKDVLGLIRKCPALAILIFHPLHKIVGVGHDLKRGTLVFVMDLFPLFKRLCIPHPKLTGLAQQSVVPDMVGVQNMAEKPLAVLRNYVQTATLLDDFFVTMKIVIEELLQKSLHGP
jgi:hypothetical protein